MFRFLEEKYREYCREELFVTTDPIQIPKIFEQKEDIEISGFLAASLSWGQRPIIIKKARELMGLMEFAPYDFIMHAEEKDYQRFDTFKHRTFNAYDCCYFLRSLSNIYRNYGGLEKIFTDSYQKNKDMVKVLVDWYHYFTLLPYEKRVLRHIANVEKGSAAKRINMFLRWMVRKDKQNIDFGLWKGIPTSALLIPLDVHSGNISRQLGLLIRKQNDLKAVIELTEKLKEFNPDDPTRYDYALFGLGAFR